MSFTSWGYFLYLFVLLILYYVIPHRYRWCVLLASSLLFCLRFNLASVMWLIATIVITYAAAIWIGWLIQREKRNAGKVVLIISLIACFGMLFLCKYLNFTVEAVSAFLDKMGIVWTPTMLNILLPIGISFYIFQETGYLIDVYRGEMQAIRHIGKYALGVSFFPKLMQGPIEPIRYFSPQIDEPKEFDFCMIRKGALTILFGLFEKVVIANRLAIAVDAVYENLGDMSGLTVLVGSVFYTMQLYADFLGYTNIALGTAQMFGFTLVPNFRRPYLSQSIAEFWRRWHISLSDWFKNYLYIPLGGNRVSSFRWAFHILIVFMVSGLWHGANWTFITWGLLHGFYQVIGRFTQAPRTWIRKKLRIEGTWISRILSIGCTFMLVNIAWIFFRAPSISDAYTALYKIGTLFRGEWSCNVPILGSPIQEFYLSIGMIVLLFAIDILQEYIVDMNMWIEAQRLPIRWVIYLTLLLGVILFGVYGTLSATSFIYVGF